MKTFAIKRAEALLEDWAYDSVNTPHVKSQVSALTDMIDTTNRDICQALHRRTAEPNFTPNSMHSKSAARDVYYAGYTQEIHAIETRAKGGSKPPLSGSTRIGKDPRIKILDALLTSKMKPHALENVKARALLFDWSEQQVADRLEIPRSTLQSQYAKAIKLAMTIK